MIKQALEILIFLMKNNQLTPQHITMLWGVSLVSSFIFFFFFFLSFALWADRLNAPGKTRIGEIHNLLGDPRAGAGLVAGPVGATLH
jgi:hypothetical protein